MKDNQKYYLRISDMDYRKVVDIFCNIEYEDIYWQQIFIISSNDYNRLLIDGFKTEFVKEFFSDKDIFISLGLEELAL